MLIVIIISTRVVFLRKGRHFLKNTTRVEIIITINVEDCTNIRAKAFVILYANCYANY